MRIIEWALWECGVRADLISQWADLSCLRERPSNLAERIAASIDLYPCDLLFIHRDAETAPPAKRAEEIAKAISVCQDAPPYICVVPVRMQEAWLLCDEKAIRTASGNPAGIVRLDMPRISRVEGIADPKELIYSLLVKASERTGRKLQQFNVSFARTIVCEHITDFSPLRKLKSFAEFEKNLSAIVKTHRLDAWR